MNHCPSTRPLLTTALIVLLAACGPPRNDIAAGDPVPVDYADDVRVWDDPQIQPDRIILSWVDDPATTQSVTWRTHPAVRGPVAEVALATADPDFVEEAVRVVAETEAVDGSAVGDDIVAHFHTATFRNLVPDTLYAYRVGDGDRWSEWFQFRTASDEPEPFSFVYFGDAQNEIVSLWSRVVRASALEAPDMSFMIHAGDLVDRAHRNTDWGEWFEAGAFLHAMFPAIATPGNHEVDPYPGADGEQLSIYWQPQFAFPENGPEGVESETAYYIDYQGTRIISLNTVGDIDVQTEWLDRVLRENPHRWAIVTQHHPVFSASSGRDNEDVREAWKPVFDRHAVDLVLQGHDHAYARGRSPRQSPGSSENVATGANLRDDETGTVYVVSVSGPKMYDLKSDGWDGYEGVERETAAQDTQLFQVIHVDGDRLRYEAFTATGQLYDAFELIKRDGRPNGFVEMAPGTGGGGE